MGITVQDFEETAFRLMDLGFHNWKYENDYIDRYKPKDEYHNTYDDKISGVQFYTEWHIERYQSPTLLCDLYVSKFYDEQYKHIYEKTGTNIEFYECCINTLLLIDVEEFKIVKPYMDILKEEYDMYHRYGYDMFITFKDCQYYINTCHEELKLKYMK